ncbi:Calcineurin-binding protein 1 [Camellia lanceoleosa]|uniref:Calcineurin-binding protein 1 n=1 Tax=Camellia lanceoleosa TaxID=1840588 RepID=A0ACC0FK18_9ERIC|nr:Calcineurin-binding protein 1 [Camellia lanceoleosa]
MQCDKQLSHNNPVETSLDKSKSDTVNVASDTVNVAIDKGNIVEKDVLEGVPSKGILSHESMEKENTGLECSKCSGDGPNGMSHGEKASKQFNDLGSELTEDEREELELGIDNALDRCCFCLYGLKLRSDSSYEDDLVRHKNTSRGDYQTKEQYADVFQYILPYAKASSLRRVLRAIRKHIPQPPDNVLAGNAIDKFLDDPNLCEDKLSEVAGSDGFLDSIMKIIFPNGRSLKQLKASSLGSSDPYLEVYCNLYYLLAQSEEMSYNPLCFESWQRLANIYDEEVDLLLNDGRKQINVIGWRKNSILPHRVETSRRRSRRCLLMTLALAKTSAQQSINFVWFQGEIHGLLALVYYDGPQNVVPFYDQRSVLPLKDSAWMMFCHNGMRHFKKAFAHKLLLGGKIGLTHFIWGNSLKSLDNSHEMSFSYYDKAIDLNPSAVDAVYRMHASRLKLLCTHGKQNKEVLKVVAEYSFSESTKENVMKILSRMGTEIPDLLMDVEDKRIQTNPEDTKLVDSHQLEEAWHMLYRDCLSALEICVEGDLKHFHKARYMLAQGLYRRGKIYYQYQIQFPLCLEDVVLVALGSLALITPLHSGLSSEIQVPNPSDLGSESSQQLCVDLQTNELWNSSFEDPNHLKNLETKWNPFLSKIKNVIIKKASEQDLETAATPLRCSYNLSRDNSCAVLPSSVNPYVVPFQLATAGHFFYGCTHCRWGQCS